MTTSPLPPVGAALDKYAPGINRLDEVCAPAFEAMALDEAMRREWPTDAHFVPYVPAADGRWFPAYPRCNKVGSSVVAELRVRGAELYTTCLVLDYDLPKGPDGQHQEWTDETWGKLDAALTTAADRGFGPASGWTWFYTSHHGARLVFALSQPVTVEVGETLVRGLIRDFGDFGIVFDPLKDWTRLFRLPRVTRSENVASGKDEKTWAQPWFREIALPDNRLDPASIRPEGTVRPASTAAVDVTVGAAPDPGEARLLVEQIGGTLTQWGGEAKKMLRGREAFGPAFEHAPMAEPGARDNTIHTMIGQAASMTRHIAGGSERHLFGLFAPALEQLVASDPSGDDWLSKGWRAAVMYWASENQKFQAEQSQLKLAVSQKEEKKVSLERQVLNGVQSWCDHPALKQGDEVAFWWLAQHLIAATDASFHVMRQDGYYDPIPVDAQRLPARVRELGMDALIGVEQVDPDGTRRQAKIGTILLRHATRVAVVEGAVGVVGSHIRNIGTPQSALVHRLFGRKRPEFLAPRYDPDVDQWLRYLCDDEPTYQYLVAWIGHALAFEDGPICALSIAGPPGCGKKMLAQGLVECVDTEIAATSREFDRFQTLLKATPFLFVNEGLAKNSFGAQHTADQFRHLVGGDPIMVEQKFRDSMQIRNPLRVVFFANNVDVVRELVGTRDLTPDDRMALAERLFHFRASETAATWLRGRGGRHFTNGWIHGDAGQRGEYRIARHFLYLHANRPPVKHGNRFLVQGNLDEDLIRQMSTRSGSAPAVVEALIGMVESSAVAPNLPGCAIMDSEIYVTTTGVVDFHRVRGLRTEAGGGLNHLSVSNVLKGLEVGGGSGQPRVIKGQNARWRRIDPKILLREAIDHGYPCKRLEQIVTNTQTISSVVDDGLRRMGVPGMPPKMPALP